MTFRSYSSPVIVMWDRGLILKHPGKPFLSVPKCEMWLLLTSVGISLNYKVTKPDSSIDSGAVGHSFRDSPPVTLVSSGCLFTSVSNRPSLFITLASNLASHPNLFSLDQYFSVLCWVSSVYNNNCAFLWVKTWNVPCWTLRIPCFVGLLSTLLFWSLKCCSCQLWPEFKGLEKWYVV